MGKSAGPPPDYTGAAREQAQAGAQNLGAQTAANRPNITTPFASQQWSRGPGGEWQLSTGLSGGLGAAAGALGGQAQNALNAPLDFGGLPALGTGEGAREQAINAAYGSATSRLDPQWGQREGALRTRLLNQGLSEGSEAYQTAMGNLGRERTDAYNQALSSAIGQGTQAGESLFGQSLAARQLGLSELLRGRAQPLAELSQLQSLLATPSFQGAGMAQAPDLLGALSAEGNYRLGDAQQQNQLWGSIAGALGNAVSAPFAFLNRGG